MQNSQIRRRPLGRGFSFPLRLNAQGGIAAAAEEQRVEESIHFILGTALGERVMLPRFGSEAHQALFSPASEVRIASIVAQARSALIRHEGRIDILDASGEIPPGADTTLLVRLKYRIRATNVIGNIVHPFYLVEGEGTA